MKINCTKIDPSGNITVIVDSYVPRELQSRVAAEIMAHDAQVEQVGFMEKSKSAGCCAHLQMMGGEFCGNASLSAAAVVLKSSAAAVGVGYEIMLSVSGAVEPVKIVGSMTDVDCFDGEVNMPLPEAIYDCCFMDGFESYNLTVVRFTGISHAIVPTGTLSREDAERTIGSWCRQINADALGLMFFDKTDSTLTPLVYVASTNTAVWEGSCASGTSAIAAYLAELDGEHADVCLKEPRGKLSASAAYSGSQVCSLTLSGSAKIQDCFSVFID